MYMLLVCLIYIHESEEYIVKIHAAPQKYIVRPTSVCTRYTCLTICQNNVKKNNFLSIQLTATSNTYIWLNHQSSNKHTRKRILFIYK